MKKPWGDKCYQTKDDKRHNTVFSQPVRVSQERWEEIFGKYKPLERVEKPKAKEVNAPHVVTWNPEWAVMATGRQMSKSELKRYCKERGKEWINQ